MFSHNLPALLRTLDVRRAPAPHATGRALAQLQLRAQEAITAPPGFLALSERLRDPAAYRALQQKRRRALEALLFLSAPAEQTRTLDLISAISEEPSWAADAGPFEDASRPAIDLQAADTAALFGWAALACGDALDPRVREHMLREAERRIWGPLLHHDDYICPVAALCASTTALVLLERDPDHLAAALRPLLRMLDAAYALAEGELLPLEERLADATAIADLALLIGRMTAGAIDLTSDAPHAAWLDELLFEHIADDWFLNPAGSMRPALSGQALFRLGRLTGDGALRTLGAMLHRQRELPSPTVTGRLFDAAHAKALSDEYTLAPRLKNAALEDGRVMIARGSSFICALTSGGNRGNVGDISIFLDGVPALTRGNLPLAQLPKPARTPVPDWDFSDSERAIMSVDLSPAYAADLRVRAHQRTLVLSRDTYGAQLVDVFDLGGPLDLRYTFHSPHRPQFIEGGVKLGPLLLHWEGAPESDARRLAGDADFPDGQWQLTLRYPEVSPRAMFTFFMRHA